MCKFIRHVCSGDEIPKVSLTTSTSRPINARQCRRLVWNRAIVKILSPERTGKIRRLDLHDFLLHFRAGDQLVELLLEGRAVHRKIDGLAEVLGGEPTPGIGFGLGSLIGSVPGPDGQPIPYAVFVAPALLATAAMNGAVYDSTNMFFRLRYEKAYDGMLATPMNVGDIALGEVVWALGRGSLYGFGFLVVMYVLGLVPSAWGLLALPASMLIGFATAAAGLTAVSFMRTWQDLDLLFVVTLPLFLFSATFFPITAYPETIRFIVMSPSG